MYAANQPVRFNVRGMPDFVGEILEVGTFDEGPRAGTTWLKVRGRTDGKEFTTTIPSTFVENSR